MSVDVYAFVDTNYFLHFRDIEDVDWRTVLECSKPTLVVCEMVISELEQFKDDRQSDRRRNRSRLALKKVAEIALAPNSTAQLREAVKVRLDMATPDSSWYVGLDPAVADHRIIAHALQFQAENPGSLVIIVSDDVGMRLKAQGKGLQAVAPPPEIKLPDEPTTTESSLRRTQDELNRVLKGIPDVSLLFDLETPSDTASYSLNPDGVLSTEEIDKEVQTRCTRVRVAWLGSGYLEYRLGDHDEKRVLAYGEQCRKYLEEMNVYRRLAGRTCAVNLAVHNAGTIPAEDVVLELSVTSPSRLYIPDDFPQAPSRPRAPNRWPNSVDLAGLSPAFNPINLARDPAWDQRSQTKVVFKLPRVLHNFPESLPPVYIHIPEGVGFDKIDIEHTLYAANVPDPKRGSLTLSFVSRAASSASP